MIIKSKIYLRKKNEISYLKKKNLEFYAIFTYKFMKFKLGIKLLLSYTKQILFTTFKFCFLLILSNIAVLLSKLHSMKKMFLTLSLIL